MQIKRPPCKFKGSFREVAARTGTPPTSRRTYRRSRTNGKPIKTAFVADRNVKLD